MQALGREALDVAEARFEHCGAFVESGISTRIVASSVAVAAAPSLKPHCASRISIRGGRASAAEDACYFNCTEPLTLAVTVPVPAAIGIVASDDIAIAFIIIGRGGGGLPLSASTFTSRTTKPA